MIQSFIYTVVTPIGFVFAIAFVAFVNGFFNCSKSKRLYFCAFLLLWVFSTKLLGQWAFEQLESVHPVVAVGKQPVADAIVVLGGGVGKLEAPRAEIEFRHVGDRLLHAARLFHAGKAKVIVVTGGKARADRGILSEAEYMFSLLLELGVPDEAIKLEKKSSNTRENAAHTALMFQNHKDVKILLVTSAFHMGRAFTVFETYGFDVLAAPTDFYIPLYKGSFWLRLVPSSTGLALFSNAFHETAAWVVFKLSGNFGFIFDSGDEPNGTF